LQVATSSSQVVVAGLDPTKRYCFAVGAVYAMGSTSYAPPVCIRGAHPTSSSTSTTTPAH
jgi:hypothetical protein